MSREKCKFVKFAFWLFLHHSDKRVGNAGEWPANGLWECALTWGELLLKPGGTMGDRFGWSMADGGANDILYLDVSNVKKIENGRADNQSRGRMDCDSRD